jgi:hypothetical protein
VIIQSKIRWALDTFKQFKSAGTDGIVPVLLQQGVEHVVPHLCHIFRACIAYGFILMAWRQVKVTSIPKPGNFIPRLRLITRRPRVKLKTSQAELCKLQRMACLGITGTMRRAPTAAMEVLGLAGGSRGQLQIMLQQTTETQI